MVRLRSSSAYLAVPVFALALAATGCAETGDNSTVDDWITTPGGGSGGTAAGGATTGGGAGGSQAGTTGGGSFSGGSFSGGTAAGGSLSGGLPSGGLLSGGGTASGGTASGGTASGGTASGGTASGGTASGGTASGGTASGGTASGGTTSGGTASGGTTSGGTAAGGTSGGRTAGGATTGGSSGIFGGLFGGGGDAGGAPVDRSAGDCCKGDDCSACVTMPPASMSGAQRGPFGGSGLFGSARSVELAGGTTYVPPEDAKGPWAGFAIIPGFTNTGPEMEDWGPFFASWGIVTVITNSGALDTPGLRGQWLLDAIGDLKEANMRNSTLMGKLSGNYGTGGYSMGGGGTTNASSSDKTLRSSIGLAPWTPVGRGITTPTIHFCGTVDLVADCSHAQASYDDIPAATPKALVTVSGCDHLLCWFGPADATGGISGELGLIWNKVYLEGDNRWKAMLTSKLKDGISASVQTNVK